MQANGGQRVEVHVVDVDVAFAVRFGVARVDDAHLVELLGGLGAVLEHGAHGGVGVDVGVLALHVGIGRLGERDVLERLDEARVDVANAVALGAVQNVGLGRLDEAGFDESLLDEILNALDRRRALDGSLVDLRDDLRGDLIGNRSILHCSASGERLLDGGCNLLLMEFSSASVAFDDGAYHDPSLPFAISSHRPRCRRMRAYLTATSHRAMQRVPQSTRHGVERAFSTLFKQSRLFHCDLWFHLFLQQSFHKV